MSDVVCRPRPAEIPGIPPRPLPIWSDMHLEHKLPMPTIIPQGAVSLYYGLMGDTPWRKFGKLDFDLDDPNNYKLPAPQEYNSLTDPHLREYFFRPDVAKWMYQRGFVTKEGKVLCNLKSYNRFRYYLHTFNTRVVRTIEKEREPEYVKDMVFSTVGHMTKHMRDLAKERKDPCQNRIRYSAVLANESERVGRYCEEAFKQLQALGLLNEGEWRHLRRVKNMLQEDCRKMALIRLRRLQDYDDKQQRGLNDWRRRKLAQLSMLAEHALRGEVLEHERMRHIRDHINYVTCKWQSMDDTIKQYARERYAKSQCIGHRIARYICIKMHRQWPQSARCPHSVLDGAKVQDCTRPVTTATMGEGGHDEPFDYTYFADLKAVIPAWKCPPRPFRICLSKPKLRRPAGTGLLQGLTGPNQYKRIRMDKNQTKMIQHVIHNAVDLVLKFSKTPDGQKRINSAPSYRCPPSHEADVRDSKSDTVNASERKAKWLVNMIFNDVGSEVQALVKQSPEVLLLVTDTLDYSVQTYKQEEGDDVVDWDNAPALKSSSHSDTGKYVRESLAVVSRDLDKDNLLASEKVVQIRELISDAITDVTLKSKIKDIEDNLIEGPEMLKLADTLITKQQQKKVGKSKDTEKKYSDCERQRMSAGVVTTLVRSVLHRLKKAIINKALTEEDLTKVIDIINEQGGCQDGGDHSAGQDCREGGGGHVKDKVAACSEKLMNSDSITRLITRTVHQVAKKRNATEDQIKSHLADAAKQFITRVVDNVFEDYNAECADDSGHNGNNNLNNFKAEFSNRVDHGGSDNVSANNMTADKRTGNTRAVNTVWKRNDVGRNSAEKCHGDINSRNSNKGNIETMRAISEKVCEKYEGRFTGTRRSPCAINNASKQTGNVGGRMLEVGNDFTNRQLSKFTTKGKKLRNNSGMHNNSDDQINGLRGAGEGSRSGTNSTPTSFTVSQPSTLPARGDHAAASTITGRVQAARHVGRSPSVSPHFKDTPIHISEDLVKKSLALISVKRDEDLNDRDTISKRNSFRNVLRPDLSQTLRYGKAASEDEASAKMSLYIDKLLMAASGGQIDLNAAKLTSVTEKQKHTKPLSYADKLLQGTAGRTSEHVGHIASPNLIPYAKLPQVTSKKATSLDRNPPIKSYADQLFERLQANAKSSATETKVTRVGKKSKLSGSKGNSKNTPRVLGRRGELSQDSMSSKMTKPKDSNVKSMTEKQVFSNGEAVMKQNRNKPYSRKTKDIYTIAGDKTNADHANADTSECDTNLQNTQSHLASKENKTEPDIITCTRKTDQSIDLTAKKSNDDLQARVKGPDRQTTKFNESSSKVGSSKDGGDAGLKVVTSPSSKSTMDSRASSSASSKSGQSRKNRSTDRRSDRSCTTSTSTNSRSSSSSSRNSSRRPRSPTVSKSAEEETDSMSSSSTSSSRSSSTSSRSSVDEVEVVDSAISAAIISASAPYSTTEPKPEKPKHHQKNKP